MSGAIDISTVNAWLPTLTAAAAGLGVVRKLSRWFDSTDARFTTQDRRLTAIEDELKPDHGKSHHDLIIAEVRQAVEDLTDDRGAHRRIRRRAER